MHELPTNEYCTKITITFNFMFHELLEDPHVQSDRLKNQSQIICTYPQESIFIFSGVTPHQKKEMSHVHTKD